MDVVGWIILSVVMVSTVVYVVFSILQGKSERSVKPRKKNNGDSIASSQITVYKYYAETKAKICPKCDGENDIGATHCGICGSCID